MVDRNVCLHNGKYQNCSELLNLMTEYSARTAEYSAAVSRLNAHMSTTTKEKYEALRDESCRFYELCKESRKAVEAHRKEHGCL